MLTVERELRARLSEIDRAEGRLDSSARALRSRWINVLLTPEAEGGRRDRHDDSERAHSELPIP